MNLNNLLDTLKQNKAKLDKYSVDYIEESNKQIEQAKKEYLKTFEYQTKKIITEKIELPKRHESYEDSIKLGEKFIIEFKNFTEFKDKKEYIKNILPQLNNKYDESSNYIRHELYEILAKLEVNEFKQNDDIKFIKKPNRGGDVYLVKTYDGIMEVEFNFKPHRQVETGIKHNDKYVRLDLTYEGKKTQHTNAETLPQLLEQINNKRLTIEYYKKPIKDVYQDFKNFKITDRGENEIDFSTLKNRSEYIRIIEVDNHKKTVILN